MAKKDNVIDKVKKENNLIRFERKVVKLKDLKFDDGNPNEMTENQRIALSTSLEKFGYVDEIVVDEDLLIANGEHRAKELIEKGIVSVEVKIMPFENDAERKLFRQTMNKVHGEHEKAKDAVDITSILQETDIDLEYFSTITAQSEKEVTDIVQELNKTPAPVPKEKDDVKKVEKAYSQLMTCPFCNKQFTKEDQ